MAEQYYGAKVSRVGNKLESDRVIGNADQDQNRDVDLRTNNMHSCSSTHASLRWHPYCRW